jgi:hypothetical protein
VQGFARESVVFRDLANKGYIKVEDSYSGCVFPKNSENARLSWNVSYLKDLQSKTNTNVT